MLVTMYASGSQEEEPSVWTKIIGKALQEWENFNTMQLSTSGTMHKNLSNTNSFQISCNLQQEHLNLYNSLGFTGTV